MVSLDFSFRYMLIEEIVEDEGVLCTEVSISCLGSYHVKRVQVVDDEFFHCVGVLSGMAYPRTGSCSVFSV